MPKRLLQGIVVSDKNDKTVVVQGRAPLHAPGAEEDGAADEEVPGARRGEPLQGRRHGDDRGEHADLQDQALGRVVEQAPAEQAG